MPLAADHKPLESVCPFYEPSARYDARMMITESFDDACAHFQAFLREQGVPSQLLWICREDLTGRRRRLVVHPAPPAINREIYRGLFEAGRKRGFGISLEVACFVGDDAGCYLFVPSDEVEADQSMLSSGLRFSYATDYPDICAFRAVTAGSTISFQIRQMWCRWRGESPLISNLPSRRQLQPARSAS